MVHFIVPHNIDEPTHPSGGNHYDRRLSDELSVAGWLVREGWAWSYRWRHSDGPFAIEEVLARKDRKGIFASAGAENPRDFRKRHGPCPMPARSSAKDQPAR